MKKETKTILIGASITLFILVLAIVIFYLVYNHTQKEEKNTILNQDYSSSKIDNNEDDNTTNTTSNNNENNISNPDNNPEKQVTLYLFRGEGCHFCENAIEFLKSIVNNYPYLEIKALEVWNNKENKELMDLVSQKLDIEIKSSVPLIIIGEDYAKRGFADGMIDGIKKEIELSYNNSKYQDIIKQVLNENPELYVTEEIIK